MGDYETNHLRINALCNEAKQFIDATERRLIKSSSFHHDLFQFFKVQRKEIDQLCSKYNNYLEESSFDEVGLVTNDTVEEIGRQLAFIKQQILELSMRKRSIGQRIFSPIARLLRMAS